MARLLTLEFASGLLVIAMGVFALVSVGDLEIGQAREMGPGYLPALLARIIVAAGVATTAWSLAKGGGTPLPEMHWRPLIVISLATLVFGLTIDRFGMVVAVVASTAVASLASAISRPRETPILCAVLAIGAVLMFIKGLALPISIWPR